MKVEIKHNLEMKRKITATKNDSDESKEATLRKQQKITNVENTSENLKFTSVCTTTHASEMNSSFCLQSVDEYLVLQSKNDMNLMKFEKNPGNHHHLQFISSKFPCPSYSVAETLNINQKRVFSSSSHLEINDVMLSPLMFPNCIPKNYQVTKCLLAPYSTNHKKFQPIVACLSSHGSLELSRYHHDKDTNETSLHPIVELCEIRKKSFSLPSSYVKFGKLQEILNELTFNNFDWCPEIIYSKRLIAAATKSKEIIFYSIDSEDEVLMLHSIKLEIVISSMKWIIINHIHTLLIANSKGSLTRFTIQISDDARSLKLVKLDEIEGKLKIAVSFIQVDSNVDSLVLISTKAHSMEITLIKNKSISSITKYVGLSITGIVNIGHSKLEYLIVTGNNKIFYMSLSTDTVDIKIDQFKKVEHSFSSGIKASKFGAHGIATSKNKVLIFIALYPQVAFDHLTLKQPLYISVNMLLNANDPYRLLVENPTRSLRNYYDCVEAVRHIGSNKLDTLSLLDMNYDIAMNEDFLYYLKIQLICDSAKLIYYQSRSDTVYNTLKEHNRLVKNVIEVINAHFLLKAMSSRKLKLSDQCKLSMRSLANFIKLYLAEEILTEPFKTVQDALKKDLEALVNERHFESAVEQETCSYCQENIESERLVCKLNHQTNRCVITKLQMPISINNFCRNCNCCAMDLDTLQKLTGREEQICPFCDRTFVFE